MFRYYILLLFLITNTSCLVKRRTLDCLDSIDYTRVAWSLDTKYGFVIKSYPFLASELDSYGSGETSVFKNSEMLYRVDKYFNGDVLIDSTGQYLVSIDFELEQEYMESPLDFKPNFIGEIIQIFKGGVKLIGFDIKELQLSCFDPDSYDYNWRSKDKTPAFFNRGTLYVNTFCEKQIQINLESLEIEIIEDNNKISCNNKISNFERKRIFWKTPDTYDFPKLENGKNVEKQIKKLLYDDLLNKQAKILIEYMEIDESGTCKLCNATIVSKESDSNKNDYVYNDKMSKKIEEWLNEQKYRANLIPNEVTRYRFRNFFYIN